MFLLHKNKIEASNYSELIMLMTFSTYHFYLFLLYLSYFFVFLLLHLSYCFFYRFFHFTGPLLLDEYVDWRKAKK